MMQHYYIVLISTVFLIVNNGELKTNKDQIAQSFNPDVLIRALGVPICVRKCIDQFVKDVADLWYMNEIVGNIQPFCRSHDAALKCIGRYATCDPHRLFKMASSSVEKMCGERAPLFEKMRPCLAKYGDIPVQVCDSRCHGSSNITAFMNNPAITIAAKMGGNIFTVNEHLGGLCSALNCALPCITMELNKVCPLSGWLTLDILLQPFDSMSNLLLNASFTLKDFITKTINKQCKFLIQKSEHVKLRKGHFNY